MDLHSCFVVGGFLREKIEKGELNNMENKNKHTPGPWTVEVCKAGQSSITGLKYEDSIIQPINVLAERHAAGEVSANAALIAAAPELLAALEKLEARVDWFLSEDFAKAFNLKYNPLSEEFFELEQARAAILKAKGIK